MNTTEMLSLTQSVFVIHCIRNQSELSDVGLATGVARALVADLVLEDRLIATGEAGRDFAIRDPQPSPDANLLAAHYRLVPLGHSASLDAILCRLTSDTRLIQKVADPLIARKLIRNARRFAIGSRMPVRFAVTFETSIEALERRCEACMTRMGEHDHRTALAREILAGRDGGRDPAFPPMAGLAKGSAGARDQNGAMIAGQAG